MSETLVAETIVKLRGEIEIVLEAAREREREVAARQDTTAEAVARAEGRRQQLEDIHELLIDAEREVRAT